MKSSLLSGVFVVVCSLWVTTSYTPNKDLPNEVFRTKNIIEADFFNEVPEKGLWKALYYYNIQFPEIVYAQAILETGHFKSNLCIRCNNLFGLYNSRKGRYYEFEHWTESVKAYRDYIQYKYKPPDDYYHFLSSIGYAEDEYYITKLRKIVKGLHNDKGGYIKRNIKSQKL